MKTLPKIKELKKKLSKKINFTKFYKKLFNKIQIQDQHIKSFISINQKTHFHKNTSLPLQNIPIAIKDLVHLKGLKCTSGSLVFKDRISTKNAKIVNRLLRAGSQIIGKNNQVELSDKPKAELRNKVIKSLSLKGWEIDLIINQINQLIK